MLIEHILKKRETKKLALLQFHNFSKHQVCPFTIWMNDLFEIKSTDYCT